MNQIEQTENDSRVLMSLEELDAKMAPVMRTKEWNALTPQQKTWVRNVVATNGNFFLASTMSYRCKSDANARTIAAQNKGKDVVRDVLAMVFPQAERDERREFFAKLQRRILSGKMTIASVEACRLLARERGWLLPENLPTTNGYTPVAQRHELGELVIQDGVKYQVTEVSDQGKILAAEPATE
jgi:hypothetical protein